MVLQVVSFNQIISITEHVVPILLSFYIGAWSDRFGRKPFLAVCMAGKLLGGVGMLLAGVYLEKMNRWMWLVVYMIPQNLSGGTLTYVMMTYSFIADNSSPRQVSTYLHLDVNGGIALFQGKNVQIRSVRIYVGLILLNCHPLGSLALQIWICSCLWLFHGSLCHCLQLWIGQTVEF